MAEYLPSQRRHQTKEAPALPLPVQRLLEPLDPLARQRQAVQAHTVRPVRTQAQVASPVLRAAGLQAQELRRVEEQQRAIQRQLAQSPAPETTVSAALQRQAQRTAPLTAPKQPTSVRDWVTVMRMQAQQAEGQRLDPRQSSQLAGLQLQVTQTIVQRFRQDRQAPDQRVAEYSGHLVNLQRHPISAAVGRAVLGMVPSGDRLVLQRAVDHTLQCEAEQQAQDDHALQIHRLQRQLAELEAKATQPVFQRIQARRGAGNPLPVAVQRHLEQGLNHDLSAVRVHVDAEADTLAKGVNAVAFTTGSDIFFRSGTFNPNTQSGLELLAHEVTHTVQQAQGRVGKGIDPDAGLEIEARTMGARLATAAKHIGQRPPSPTLAPQSAGGGFVVQRLQTSRPLDQALIQANVLLRRINAALGLKLKSARDLYPLLKTDAQQRGRFFAGIYPAVPPASELGRLLASSNVPLIQGYVQGRALLNKGLTWDLFPQAVKRLFSNAGVVESSNVIILFGGKASVLRHRFGGEALVEGTPTDVTVHKQVKFNAIGTFPATFSYAQAKSQFIAKSSAVWSNTRKLLITDPKNTKFRQELPIKVVIEENSASKETINIYGSKADRARANGITLEIFLHNEEGLLEPQFALVAAHEVGHFILGAKDEYEDVKVEGKVTGSRSTTNDKSIMAVFYDYPNRAVAHPRHFSELLANFKTMYPGKQVVIK